MYVISAIVFFVLLGACLPLLPEYIRLTAYLAIFLGWARGTAILFVVFSEFFAAVIFLHSLV